MRLEQGEKRHAKGIMRYLKILPVTLLLYLSVLTVVEEFRDALIDTQYPQQYTQQIADHKPEVSSVEGAGPEQSFPEKLGIASAYVTTPATSDVVLHLPPFDTSKVWMIHEASANGQSASVTITVTPDGDLNVSSSDLSEVSKVQEATPGEFRWHLLPIYIFVAAAVCAFLKRFLLKRGQLSLISREQAYASA